MIISAKNIIVAKPSKCICEIGKYLKSIANDSKVVCDEIINITVNIPTNVRNNIPTNVTNTVSINSDDETVRNKTNYYIFYTVLLVIVYYLSSLLLFLLLLLLYYYITIITIIIIIIIIIIISIICNGCHDLTILCANINDIIIITVKC